MLSSTWHLNDNWHNSNNLHHNTEGKGLNPFDVTGAISLHPPKKITSIGPSRFSLFKDMKRCIKMLCKYAESFEHCHFILTNQKTQRTQFRLSINWICCY